MKILHVIHSLDLRSGGPSAALRQLAKAQAAAGNDVAIICTDVQSAEPWSPREVFRQALLNDEDLSQVRLHILQGYGRVRPLARFRFVPQAKRDLEKLFENRSHPELVHIHGLFSHLTMTAARASRRWNIPYVMRPAGGLNPLCLRAGNALGKRLLYRLAERRNLQSAAFVHATSKRESAELQRLLPEQKIVIIPHGTTLPDVKDKRYPQQVFYRKFPEFENRPMVLFLSRLAPKKRLDLLVKGFAKAQEDHPGLMLAVAGPDAGEKARVERLVQSEGLGGKVRFLGFLTGLLKEGAFAAASVLALPSKDENFGLVVIEAMAHGLPVLVSDGVDSHVYVRRAKCGTVVKSNSAAVGKGLSELLRQPLEEVGERGRQYVEEHLAWPRIAAALGAHYEAVT